MNPQIKDALYFIAELDTQHETALSRENEFKPVLGNHAFYHIRHTGEKALREFKKDALTGIGNTLIKDGLSNAGINLKDLIENILREEKDVYLEDFNNLFNILKSRINAMKPDQETASLNHILKTADGLYTHKTSRQIYNQETFSFRKKDTLKVSCTFWDCGFKWISSYSHYTVDYLNALAQLCDIVFNGALASAAQNYEVGDMIHKTAKEEQSLFFGKWHVSKFFNIKCHKNGNAYIKFGTVQAAGNIESTMKNFSMEQRVKQIAHEKIIELRERKRYNARFNR